MTTSIALVLALTGCNGKEDWTEHGPIAENIMGRLGDPLPNATPEQLETFARGLAVGEHRFAPSEGLGPAFNTSFCLSCHEKPTFGGSAGLYRSFFLSGRLTNDGAFQPGESAGAAGGVIRLNNVGSEHLPRPEIPESTTILAQRNPIPFYGVGLIAEIPDEEILKRADPDDEDGDGISGRANYDRGFVGRFGRKSQTVSIEGFIRGPLFNHLGITSDPLSDAQRAMLPVDSSSEEGASAARSFVPGLFDLGQAAAPDGPLTDDDGVPDPELSSQELFDIVSYSMLLAAPLVDEPTPQSEAGRLAFNEARCTDCHTHRLEGPRGPLHVYSDFLLHDMGPELADGLVAKDASGSEFRTQPLWGIASVGPYLHDGRATTLHDAILAHGGEGSASQEIYAGFSPSKQADLNAFLVSLGGADQFTAGLIPPDEPIAPVGSWGGPLASLDDEDAFLRGRAAFDFEFGYSEGIGGPRFNGDSCRACHFQPVVGGAGPLDLNVMRHGLLNEQGAFVTPEVGTILHRLRRVGDGQQRSQPGTEIWEMRQSPHLLGLGLIDAIPEATVLANADPDDTDGDGISGRPSFTDDGRLGRFGWKASIPSIREFVRDAVTMELGMTLPFQQDLTFGRVQDNDDTPDPEVDLSFAADLEFYLRTLGPPPRTEAPDAAAAARGEAVFAEVGCTSCHIPELVGDAGPARLYSDLLLHEVLPPGALGIEEASATMREFRTAPLWGISQTAPYLHHGLAETLEQAIVGHDGEARPSRDAFEQLSATDRDALIAFLETL